jgi:hypothetical protein
MKMRILALAIVLALCWATVSAEKIAKPGADPIQAELMADLHARLLKVGGTVYARVTVEWRSPACLLRNGAVLEAHVVSVANGNLALKGDSTLNECGHAAEGSANREAFVVKIVQSTLPVPPGVPMSASQFSSEELRVYRAADGKRLLSVRAGPPSLSRDGYALAPDASQLAVLTRDQLAIYSVPGK